MRFDGGRGQALQKVGFSFDLDKASYKGPKNIALAARDPVMPPQDPTILAMAEKALCVVGLGVNCYVVKNVYEMEMNVEYGAPLEVWQAVFDQLLKQAMEYEPTY
jgi:hypothetical protein